MARSSRQLLPGMPHEHRPRRRRNSIAAASSISAMTKRYFALIMKHRVMRCCRGICPGQPSVHQWQTSRICAGADVSGPACGSQTDGTWFDRKHGRRAVILGKTALGQSPTSVRLTSTFSCLSADGDLPAQALLHRKNKAFKHILLI